ncbi:MAG: Hsp20/alpha crystallin family protein [Anaerolineaceae bacterium]|nr:Hsp20/alpha crystallin family protein [Anaerolineaceae bacterium]
MRRSYSTPSMWREMNHMRNQMNRLFRDANSFRFATSAAESSNYPAVNIWTNEDGQIVTAELPDVDVKDLEITIAGQELTLSGTRKNIELVENAQYHRQERSCGEFQRKLELPHPVEASKVSAKLENGVLHLTLPRAEMDKPRKIRIN